MKHEKDTLTKALDDMEEILDLTLDISQSIAKLSLKVGELQDFQEQLEFWYKSRH